MKEIYRSERSEAMADIYKDVMYDYCAILIISILIITTILRRMVKGKVNRSFMEVLVVAWLAVLFDVWARYLDNLGVQQMVTKYAVHMGYLVLSSFAMPFYIAYVVSMTDTWHLFKAKRFLTFLSLLPVFAITAMIVVSPATKWIFYINAECEYTRGRYFSLIYVCTVIYVIYGLIYLGIFRKMFRRRYLVPLGIVFAAAIANTVIRFFYPTAVVEMLCMAIGLMFISLMLQRPEERLDMITGLDKMTAYMDDMRHAFRTRKPIHIIMVNITNYASLRELLGYGKCMQVMAGISEYMMRLDKEKKSKAAMYYLGQGKFRYVLEDTLSDHVPDIAEEINRTLKTCFVINQMSVNFIANICIADCPEDVSASPAQQASPPHFLCHHRDTSRRCARPAGLHVQAAHFHPGSVPDSSRHALPYCIYHPVGSLPAPDSPSHVPHRRVPSSTHQPHSRFRHFWYEIHYTAASRYNRNSPSHHDSDIASDQNHIVPSATPRIPPIASIHQV
jgi:GGDEF domain-containing protein/lipoprotein signal peptidase